MVGLGWTRLKIFAEMGKLGLYLESDTLLGGV